MPHNGISRVGMGRPKLDPVRAWLEAYADHVRKRFNSRAVVSVRLAGAPPVELSHLYALESGGLVLVTCCEHPEHHHDGAGEHHHHATPEHHRTPNPSPPEGEQGHAAGHGQPDPHGGPPQHRPAAPPGDHAHDHEKDDDHHHAEGEACGASELWLASPDLAVFEVHCAEEGVLCTGFGYLGLSRTPHMLVRRGTQAPPKTGHEHGNF